MANINEIVIPQADETIKINKHKVTIRTSISTNDFATAVHTIADSCFVDGEYRPEYKEIAKRYAVLKYLTDIDLGEIEVNEIFELSQASWYLDIENACAKYTAYYDIQKAADELIDYRIRTHQTNFDDLCDTLKEFAEKMGDTKALEDIATRLGNLNDKEVVSAIVNK